MVELEESVEVEAIPEVFELNMEVENIDIPATFILSKPSNIYDEVDVVTEEIAAEEKVLEITEEFIEVNTSINFDFTESVIESALIDPALHDVVTAASEIVTEAPAAFESSFRMVSPAAIEEAESEMQLVIREEAPMNKMGTRGNSHSSYDMPIDDAEEQRRKVAERIQKLRNLSFNINNGSDPNTEFDAVPAYVRRNLDLFGNTMASVENYYSKYTVEQDENNQTQISTINSFLDGKKPD